MHAYQNLEYNITVAITMITLTTKVKHSQEELKKQNYQLHYYSTMIRRNQQLEIKIAMCSHLFMQRLLS
jgi:hypothetical protein